MSSDKLELTTPVLKRSQEYQQDGRKPQRKERRRPPSSQKDDDDDSSWDTDLEGEELNTTYDITGKSIYLEACTEMGVVPASYFIRHMTDKTLEMRHHGLGINGSNAIAVPLCTNTTVLSLDLSDNNIEGEGAQYIADMLTENCYICDLNLSNNNLGSEGAIALCDMFPVNRTLRKINLSANNFTDNDAPVIANFILDNNRIQDVNISYNKFSEKGGELLGPAISENEIIERLDISWNHLRLKGGIAVVDGVKTNARLKSVNLSFNGLGNDSAYAVAELLKFNNVLLELDISNNRITPQGGVIIAKGLDANETMKILKLANNPIGAVGALTILQAIDNDRSLLKVLDLSGIQVCKEFDKIHKEMIESNRDILILHGGILSNYVIKGSKKANVSANEFDQQISDFFGTPLEVFMKTDPMAIIKTYIDQHNLRLVDLFNRFDKDKNYNITRDEFKKGNIMSGIGLTEDQIVSLIARLDKDDNDGMINYSELAKGSKDLLEQIRLISKFDSYQNSNN